MLIYHSNSVKPFELATVKDITMQHSGMHNVWLALTIDLCVLKTYTVQNIPLRDARRTRQDAFKGPRVSPEIQHLSSLPEKQFYIPRNVCIVNTCGTYLVKYNLINYIEDRRAAPQTYSYFLCRFSCFETKFALHCLMLSYMWGKIAD